MASSFARFRDIVLENESLQAELLEITDRTEFVERVVALGTAREFDFGLDDVEAEMRAARKDWIERQI